MAIRSDWVGVWFGAFGGLVGVGVVVIWPTATIGWLFIATGVVGAITAVLHKFLRSYLSFLIGLIIFLFFWWFWYKYSEVIVPRQENNTAKFDNTVGVECTFSGFPIRASQDHKVYIMPILITPEIEIPHVFQIFEILGNKDFNEIPRVHDEIYKCEIKNYGIVPIAKFRASFKINIIVAPGKEIFAGTLNLPPVDLGIASDNKREVFIWNVSQYSLRVIEPDVAQAWFAGEPEPRSIKVLAGLNAILKNIMFSPYSKIIIPPVAIPQSPTPPSTPTEK